MLEEVGRRCQPGGVSLCYLPVAQPLGMDEKALDRLLAITPAEVVHLALDTAEALRAGADLAKLARKHARRLKVVRYRDASAAPKKTSGGKAAPTPAMGRGAVKFEALGKALRDTGYAGWVTLDVSGESQEPRRAVENGYRFMARRSGLMDE